MSRDELLELIDGIYARLELLEKAIARAQCSSEGWRYNALDLVEQVYDLLSTLRAKLKGES